MTTVPIPAFPRDAEGFEHPNWCDLTECTSPSALRIRSAETDVPVYMQDHHLSTPQRVPAGRYGEVDFIVQVGRDTNQPVTDKVDGVDLIIDFPVCRLRVGLPVAVDQLGPLTQVLTAIRDIAIGGESL